MKISVVVAAVMLLFFSCSPKLPPDNNWAIGKWLLTELKGVPVQISGNIGKNAHLIFETGQKAYRGFGGCNNISGTYSISNGNISFTAQSARLADCPDVPFESVFLNTLGEVNKFTVTGNLMVLKRGSTVVIKLQRL